MHKTGIVLLSSLFMLAAYGGEDTTELSSESPVVEIEAMDTHEPDIASGGDGDTVHTYGGLVNQTTFTEEYGLQAWDDYQKNIKDVELWEFSEKLKQSAEHKKVI